MSPKKGHAASSGIDGFECSRRNVLFTGAGVLGLSALHVAAPPTSALRGNFRYVVFDGRIPQSAAFAAARSRRGGEQLDVARGLTALWQQKLLPLWRRKGGRVAGLTSMGVYAALAEQARSEGYGAFLIGRHSVDEQSGIVSHSYTVPVEAVKAAAAIGAEGQAWPRRLAELVGACRFDAKACLTSWSNMPSRPISADHLASWIIG